MYDAFIILIIRNKTDKEENYVFYNAEIYIE